MIQHKCSSVVTHSRAFRKDWLTEITQADRKAKAKKRYDAHARMLLDLPLGAIVRVQDRQTKRWVR